MADGATGGVEGGLSIRVTVQDGRIVAVELSSTRPVKLCTRLVGCEVGAAMALLPRLFGVCRVAQAVAGLAAVETALGMVPAPPQLAARRFLVAAESLEQTAWRLLLDWPRCVGASPALEPLKRVRQLLSILPLKLFPDRAWHRIGGARLAPARMDLATMLDQLQLAIHQAVCDDATRNDWPLTDRRNFERWLRRASTPAALTLRCLCEQGLADFGRGTVEALPAFDLAVLERRMAAADGDAFCARPDLDGAVHETGALARLWVHPLIADLRADHGNGLLTRWAARWVELDGLLTELRRQWVRLEEHPGSPMEQTDAGVSAGFGFVESARGRLCHRVAVAVGKVTDYKILAPTEWNFHPEGPLARGLAGARVAEAGAPPVRRAVTLLATVLDPCVGFELVVEES
ncbi:MAG: nickel-dependent hydrogenase large subunit [Candidatus Competibacter sp.]|nr:nickel-dependent hydrogenase large subunit [Candidatus Competibacter sp.]MDG4583782.1 nickel-dependent hydrogenase large subunit [Candidatus Competibacter sp.]